jgi:hypothetical protein
MKSDGNWGYYAILFQALSMNFGGNILASGKYIPLEAKKS